ncbi:BPSS1780 family membrane protein [Trinickia diaoshuihuensis]|uniref:BPSS1780 family membrane protein n=1 Tax=Trinickia diaoshuihuensis TaxID=2292265 RepID=UPI000E2297BE|nr:BPSS1780 family membrane protein [Trinickia diaoshuihuensis]
MSLHYLSDVSKTAHRRPAPEPAHLEGLHFDAMYIFDWLETGWRAARIQPMLWLGTFLACAAFAFACKHVPLLRPTIVLIAPLAVGMLMVAQERVRIGRPARARDLIAALAQHHYALLAIGVTAAALIVLGYVISAIVVDASVLKSFVTSGPHHLSISYGGPGPRGTIATLVALPIFTVALAAAWFAPALVVLRDAGPLDAMAASLHGALRNWRTTLIYVVAVADALLLAHQVPLLASSLALLPPMLLTIYGGYRDLFAPGASSFTR